MWFATHLSRQYPLEVSDENDRRAAEAAFAALVASLTAEAVAQARSVPPSVPEPRAPEKTVGEAVVGFLAKKAGEVERGRFSPGALAAYRVALEVHLAAAFGARPLSSLTAEELEAWADRPGWSDTYRANTLGAAGTFLKWAGHPLHLARPAKESRGADVVLTDEQFAQVLRAYDANGGGDFRALLTLLRETGARPQEAAGLTAEGVNWPNASATLREHKSKRHGKGRTLHFGAAAVAVLEAQRAKYRAGLLFRTKGGRAYSKKAICRNMLKISERVGFRAIAYGLGRHSFCTKALASGIPDTVVAALLGHSSTRMIHTNYSHVNEQSRVLKAALEKLGGPEAG